MILSKPLISFQQSNRNLKLMERRQILKLVTQSKNQSSSLLVLRRLHCLSNCFAPVSPVTVISVTILLIELHTSCRYNWKNPHSSTLPPFLTSGSPLPFFMNWTSRRPSPALEDPAMASFAQRNSIKYTA